GEMQRLMLARALYKNADTLILDEPTSALDPLAEAAMYQNYYQISENKTSIFISHRLSSTRFCDRILLLSGGRIAEEGTHQSLLQAGGLYAQLFQTQAQYYQKEEQHETN
ncbi:MAG: ABC transporter ATP-binding protein, partial [Firmicutes bacterium]|nr:ABC transporter ATP-binding protein [Bacillota bacterium]